MALTSEQVITTTDFPSFISSTFRSPANAICWPRSPAGDFAEIVAKVDAADNIVALSPADLLALDLRPAGQLARKTLLEDLAVLTEHGAAPTLNVIRHYDRDDSFPLLPTDVYSFHVDRSPVPADTYLCTYHGAPSDIVPNDQVVQKILIPELRAELRALYDGPDDGFDDFLAEYYFDLHYQLLPGAQPLNLGNGNLWRLATDHPGNPVLPCVHRAPVEDGARLMLIC